VSAPNEQDQADSNATNQDWYSTTNPCPSKTLNQGSSAFNQFFQCQSLEQKLAPEKFRGDFHKVKDLFSIMNDYVPRTMLY